MKWNKQGGWDNGQKGASTGSDPYNENINVHILAYTVSINKKTVP